MSEVLVFYAGLLYREYNHDEFRNARYDWPQDLYNGAWIYVHIRSERHLRFGVSPGWWKADLTPVLIEDVPKELRTIVLLMS